jgi:general secretion pathway protein K
MTPEILEKLSKVVTVFPQEGGKPVNINTADPLVIQALDNRITQSIATAVIQARPFKVPEDLDRVSSFEDIGKVLRPAKVYDVKSTLFLARLTVRVNEVTRNATVVLEREPNKGTSSVLYYRVL